MRWKYEVSTKKNVKICYCLFLMAVLTNIENQTRCSFHVRSTRQFIKLYLTEKWSHVFLDEGSDSTKKIQTSLRYKEPDFCFTEEQN